MEWADALIARIGVDPMAIDGMPGIAISFPPPVGAPVGSMVYSGAVRALHLVQGKEHRPLLGISTHRFPHVVSHLPTEPERDRMHPLVRWLSGYAAWDALVDSQGGTAAEFLDSHGDGLNWHFARMISKVLPDAGFEPHFLQALKAIQGWGWGPASGVDKLFKPTLKAAGLRRIVRANPLLTEICYAETDALTTDERDADLSVIMPGLKKAAMARLRTPAWSLEAGRHGALTGHHGASTQFKHFLPQVPPDWLPGDVEGIRAFLKVFGLLKGLGFGAIGARQLIRSCGGDWSAFHAACVRASGGGIENFGLEYLSDPARDFAGKVVTPLIERAGLPRKSRVLMPDPHRQAFRLLYRDKSLPGCIEASKRWHARLPRLLAEMPHESDDNATWPALYPETRVGDLVVVPITDAMTLAEEGSPDPDRNGVRGLNHCSASYRAAAWRGETHVFSVRRVHPDGNYERLATMEMAGEGGGVSDIVQTSGYANGRVTDEVAMACRGFAEMHAGTERPRQRRRTSGEEVREDCGFDWRDDALMDRACRAYGFMLPRDLRGGIEPLSGAVLAMRVASGT